MLFNFELTPIDEIRPCGNTKNILHWFGLTDGWYWMEVGGDELFRHSDSALRYWANIDPAYVPHRPYVDYYVVRLWEDVLASLPSLTNPIPTDLASMVKDGDSWRTWLQQVKLWAEDEEAETNWDLYMEGTLWWGERTLDSGYLMHPPRIYLWTVADTAHIRWDNRNELLDDGIPKWQAGSDEISMPVAEFIEEVKSFHTRLIAAMDDRIASIKQGWSRPEIEIDIDQLDREQHDRSTWLTNAINRKEQIDWTEVGRTIDRILHEIPYGDR